MGLSLVEYLGGGAKLSKAFQHIAASGVLHPCDQLSVGKRARSPFSELDIGVFVKAAAAFEKLRRIYENAAGRKDFGNGRFVRELLEHAEMNLSERVMELQSEELTPEVLGRIEECDITDLSVRAKVFERRIGFAKNSA